MSPPVITPPKAVDDISTPEDRFRCVPYNAVLFARTCVSRQDMLGKPREQRTGDYAECEGCQAGMTIREKLGAGPAPAAAGKSPHGPGLPYYVPKMPGRARLPVAAPKPPPQAPSPRQAATPAAEAPVKRKPGRPPKPKAPPLPSGGRVLGARTGSHREPRATRGGCDHRSGPTPNPSTRGPSAARGGAGTHGGVRASDGREHRGRASGLRERACGRAERLAPRSGQGRSDHLGDPGGAREAGRQGRGGDEMLTAASPCASWRG
jgi:hypothetical protein